MKPVQYCHSVLWVLLLVYVIAFPGTAWSQVQGAGLPVELIHMDLEMNFNWSNHKAKGSARYKIQAHEVTQQITLRCERLKVLKVEGAGMGNISYTLDTVQHLLILKTEKPLQQGKIYSLKINFETTQHNPSQPEFLGGSFGRGIRYLQPDPLQPWIRTQLWTQSEATAYATWYPGPVDFSDAFTASLIVSAPSDLSVVAPGVLKNVTRDGSNQLHHFECNQPIVPYLLAIVIGDYKAFQQQYQSTTITTYCYSDEVDAAKASFVRLPEMFSFLESYTGLPFPLKEYRQVVVQDYPFPGLTGQHGMAILSDNAIDDAGTHKDYQYLWDGVIFHALANQWLGNKIYPSTPKDAWITKGLCQYLEGKFTAKVHGEEEYHLWYHPWEIANMSATEAICPLYSEAVLGNDGFFNEALTTYKAAGVWRMLELEIGDAGIQMLIRQLLSAKEFRPIETQEVLKLINSSAGRDMSWFFNQWVYGTAVPTFEVIEQFQPDQNILSFQLWQATGSNQNTFPFFEGKVRLSISNKDTLLEIKPQASNVFVFKLEDRPEWVRIDPLQEWWGHWKQSIASDALMREATKSTYSWNRGKAINDLIKNKNESRWETELKPTLIELLEDNIKEPGYWRWKMSCLNTYARIEQPPYTDAFKKLLVHTIHADPAPWVRATALNVLGNTRDSSYAPLYLSQFKDSSDRVVSAAAIALGKTGAAMAYPALMQLRFRPSWKSQSLMHCMNGLAQLKDPRGISVCLAAIQDQHSPRWLLGNGWDFPVVAAQTLAALGGSSQAFPFLSDRLMIHLENGNAVGMTYDMMLLTLLSPPELKDLFPVVEEMLHDTPSLLELVKSYEATYNEQNK